MRHNIFTDLLLLVYPPCCIVCRRLLVEQEELVCLHCFTDLLPTDFHLRPENEIAQKFYGKVNIKHAMSCFHFVRRGKTQKILHHLKYKNEEKLSRILGLWYGNHLRKDGLKGKFDVVTPVPLHPKKLLRRGYNQSEGFAAGIASCLDAKSLPHLIERKKMTHTQTRKNRIERWQNVKGVFGISKTEAVAQKDVLLVDDVVTTGATLESCANALHTAGCRSVSVATIAYA